MLSQIAVALSVLNVWLLRSQKATAWRGGNALSLRDEFRVYGLPDWFMTATGVFKVCLALALLAGLWMPSLARPAAIGVAIFMTGAVVMHVKVSDPFRKAVPALSLGLLATIVSLA